MNMNTSLSISLHPLIFLVHDIFFISLTMLFLAHFPKEKELLSALCLVVVVVVVVVMVVMSAT